MYNKFNLIIWTQKEREKSKEKKKRKRKKRNEKKIKKNIFLIPGPNF